MKYTKKPVVIEAMQLPMPYPDGVDASSDDYAKNLQAAAVLDWLRSELGDGYDPLGNEIPASGWTIDPANGFLRIATLEGVMQAKPGDWIIRGVQGEFYPCKPDIFAATYDEIEELEPYEMPPALIIENDVVTAPVPAAAQAVLDAFNQQHVAEIRKALEPFGLHPYDLERPRYRRVVRDGETTTRTIAEEQI